MELLVHVPVLNLAKRIKTVVPGIRKTCCFIARALLGS